MTAQQLDDLINHMARAWVRRDFATYRQLEATGIRALRHRLITNAQLHEAFDRFESQVRLTMKGNS